ncbi:MAG: Hsp20/alpha crystallin family protein [Bdellovibrionota bacterium]
MTALDVWRGDRPSLLSSWEPFSRDFDRMFSDMERSLGSLRGWSANGPEFVPACDIEETESEYHLSMDVPGLEKDDIRIEVVGNSVSISGERKQEKEEKGANQYRLERSYGKFNRTFTLPDGVKEENIEANYDNGVLCLTLPKSEKSKAKRISVKSGKPGFVAKLAGKGKNKAANE